ncbi:alanyl-tRNA editing protein Aarsd1-B-like [Haliotis cracherodii]|uniref:alanyl-tRNA editing protein Aarsd1-B-like n=1 Tax=Haliotis cracherodii TaxID=6455 RepID=UPI0039EB5314
MALACQRDSYLTQLTSVVKSCKPAQLTVVNGGKKEKLSGFDVVLEDTILFPEGGGQPDDRGAISGKNVLRITRSGADAVHFVTEEIPPETQVDLQIDWKRRFDHMQQHSGQHLITALADSMYGYKTTSWNLGEKVSFIELDTPQMKADELVTLEETVNAKIRDAVPMTPKLYENKDDPELAPVRARGLPDDHVGPVRVVTIEGIDSNMCCGTHVSNMAHLQAIKLLYTEKGKKGKINLFFVAGDRVLSYLGRCCAVEKTLTGVLKGPLDQHVDLADKAVKGWKAAQKTSTGLLKEVAVLEAQAFKSKVEKENVFVTHRKEGDGDYMNILVGELLAVEGLSCLVTVGDEKGAGLFVFAGPEAVVKHMGPKICDLLEGKGALNGGRYRGKANKMANRSKAEAALREYFQQTKPES